MTDIVPRFLAAPKRPTARALCGSADKAVWSGQSAEDSDLDVRPSLPFHAWLDPPFHHEAPKGNRRCSHGLWAGNTVSR